MKELAPDIEVTAEMIVRVVESHDTHLFSSLDNEGHVIGCASLCVFESPTGRKASVEDVVVLSSYRGQGLGKRLMEHLIDYVRENLGEVDLHLTSHPTRVAANALYQSLGFEKRDTNFYRMTIRQAEEKDVKNGRN
jgi:ribosomal protein S18 acetylase RimI-like enzyme